MRWQRALPSMLVLVGVPVGILLVVLVIVQYRPGGGENLVGVKANHVGRALMLDPQGDAEMARRILASANASGTPEVVLSRKVLGGELPCLGFEGSFLESRPADTFGLVVLGGDLRPSFLGGIVMQPPVPYIAYVYDVRHGEETAEGPAEWPWLRAAFGGPGWPEDSPMYLSPEGQPSLVEPGHYVLPHPRPTEAGQDMHVSQEIGEWRVTVARVYGESGPFRVVYTVTGPRSRYTVDPPLLKIGDKELQDRSGGLKEALGPRPGTATFWGMPELAQPQDVTLSFVVPAIHVRPVRSPCEVPGTDPTSYPTPTPLPSNMQPGAPAATPAPDIQMVGPFTFHLNVHIVPTPTQPPVPTPVPTQESALPPLPQPTGQP